MIVTDHPEGLRFITQNDHAALAGQLAEQWGGDGFDPPGVPGAAVFAAYAHDAGWWRWDLRPRLGEDGAVLGFLDVSPEQWTRSYTRGIGAVADADAYAGLLCSMHGSGVRRQRYGTHTALPDRSEAFADFIASEETRQSALVDSLRSDPSRAIHAEASSFLDALHDGGVAPDDIDGGSVWFDYRLLQAWDRLSLYLCTAFDYESTGVGPVPRTPGGEPSRLELVPLDEATLRIAPYPFGASPTTVHVPGRVVPRPTRSSESALVDDYYSAGVRRIEFTLTR